MASECSTASARDFAICRPPCRHPETTQRRLPSCHDADHAMRALHETVLSPSGPRSRVLVALVPCRGPSRNGGQGLPGPSLQPTRILTRTAPVCRIARLEPTPLASRSIHDTDSCWCASVPPRTPRITAPPYCSGCLCRVYMHRPSAYGEIRLRAMCSHCSRVPGPLFSPYILPPSFAWWVYGHRNF